ncbi:MAG: hypothetical protein A2754_03435 [Candidatus Magasanikbacteria bacterium RIFCSPHIGHO2_01_FULL_47_8]|uniref:YoaR-like putative peptidoglycan binding domain-containing protein n=1 Tax=Candidatus Magasanikbacteria bacterium RIFCSPHIGHO2_01_FULL_47_8 TaxID=1798673 RepID=A0A1F6MB17_9BACT|nr:MAG: hypothetical protein A2754_03435 [Candidatus Magasanikbacteria bacterium RIFCSPHIGHO2_01_FULL_47_8]
MSVRSKLLVIFSVKITILLLVLVGYAVVYEKMYEKKVFPGVYMGDTTLSGMTRDELVRFIENFNNLFSKEGIRLTVTDQNGEEHKITLSPIVSGGDNAVEILRLNSDEFARLALGVGRSPFLLPRLWEPLINRFIFPRRLTVPVSINEKNLIDALRQSLGKFEQPPENARVSFTNPFTTDYKILPERAGVAFDYSEIARRLRSNVSRLSFDSVKITLTQYSPTVTAKEVEAIAARLPMLFEGGEFVMRYEDGTGEAEEWAINPGMLKNWLDVERGEKNSLLFSLTEAEVKNFLDTIKPDIEVEAREAKFEIENGKVKEFQASRTGIALDGDASYQAIAQAFRERNFKADATTTVINLATIVAEPKLKTTEVNDFGISEIIGSGTSTFKDSHTNRIKNIAHAVERLNGVLIKPDEEFSALKSAGPFTSANGYLPEQVIKGREIKLEIGGGMCQIGTTLFRMAMNSGMDITARRNHSLVVGYYADPVNGNPGTDATLYEPYLDLKFKNDTGSHLLLQTAIDYNKQMLTFTLWGKPDGRAGWYTHPLVSKWIPSGDPQEIKVDDGTLKPGEIKCQAAFRGAVASFIYTRITPAGERLERIFDSYYRPLPKICTVGVEKGMVTSTPPLPLSLFEAL